MGELGVVCGYSAGAVGLEGWTGVVWVTTVVLPSQEEHGTVMTLVVYMVSVSGLLGVEVVAG